MIRKWVILILLAFLYCKKPPEPSTKIDAPPQKSYFIVTTKDGLNLRQDPGTAAKVIAVLPYKFRGEILEKQKNYEVIQDAYGYWAKVRYKDKVGWIFSGFIWLLYSIDEFVNIPENAEQELNIADSMTETDLPEIREFNLNRYRRIASQFLGGNEYDIFLEKIAADQECEGLGLLILSKDRKRAYQTRVIKPHFKIITPNNARALMFFDVFGYCGCGGHLVVRTLFQGKTGIKTFSMDAPNTMKVGGSCAMFDAHTPAKNEMRYDSAANILLVHSFTTSCRPVGTNDPQGKVNRFHSGVFRVYDFAGDVGRRSSEEEKDMVPDNYKVNWQALPPL